MSQSDGLFEKNNVDPENKGLTEIDPENKGLTEIDPENKGLTLTHLENKGLKPRDHGSGKTKGAAFWLRLYPLHRQRISRWSSENLEFFSTLSGYQVLKIQMHFPGTLSCLESVR